jgi:hypothetical protein
VIAYLDDDCIADPQWLEQLQPEFGNPAVAAVTGSIRSFSENSDLPSCCQGEIGDSRERTRREIGTDTRGWFELANFGAIGDGGNMAIRAQMFSVWPGFDQRLGRGAPLGAGEEHLAFFQFLLLGYRIVYQPNAVVQHPIPATCQEARARAFAEWRSTAAYIALLWNEVPQFRNEIRSYVAGRLRARVAWGGTQRPEPRSTAHPLPWWKWLSAVEAGIRLYWRTARATSAAAPIISRTIQPPAKRAKVTVAD